MMSDDLKISNMSLSYLILHIFVWNPCSFHIDGLACGITWFVLKHHIIQLIRWPTSHVKVGTILLSYPILHFYVKTYVPGYQLASFYAISDSHWKQLPQNPFSSLYSGERSGCMNLIRRIREDYFRSKKWQHLHPFLIQKLETHKRWFTDLVPSTKNIMVCDQCSFNKSTTYRLSLLQQPAKELHVSCEEIKYTTQISV